MPKTTQFFNARLVKHSKYFALELGRVFLQKRGGETDKNDKSSGNKKTAVTNKTKESLGMPSVKDL